MAVRPAELLLPTQLALSGCCSSARTYKDVFKVWLHVNSLIKRWWRDFCKRPAFPVRERNRIIVEKLLVAVF